MPAYTAALERSGHHPTTQSTAPAASTKRQRRRKIIWFNPPWNQNVTTDVARRFLALVRKHFPKHHRYHKLFNMNNVKCSYSCMPSMGAIISAHNAKVLGSNIDAPSPPSPCNCRVPADCPLDRKCQTPCIVYKATVTAPARPPKIYYGLTEGPFKERYRNHTFSFRHKDSSMSTELSKYIWQLKDEDVESRIKWEIVRRAVPYRCGTRKCDLCLSEKLVIATADPSTMLNKRSELISKCRHRNKYNFKQRRRRGPPR